MGLAYPEAKRRLRAAVEVYREPGAGAYAFTERLTSGPLAPTHVSGVTLDVGALVA